MSWLDPRKPHVHRAKLTCPSPQKNSAKSKSPGWHTLEFEANKVISKINTAGARHRISSKTTIAIYGGQQLGIQPVNIIQSNWNQTDCIGVKMYWWWSLRNPYCWNPSSTCFLNGHHGPEHLQHRWSNPSCIHTAFQIKKRVFEAAWLINFSQQMQISPWCVHLTHRWLDIKLGPRVTNKTNIVCRLSIFILAVRKTIPDQRLRRWKVCFNFQPKA